MNIFRNKIQAELTSKIEELENTISTLDSENEKLNEENKTLTQEILELKNQLETKAVVVEETETQLSEVVEEVKELVEQRESVEEIATTKAIEILASVGQPPVDIEEDEVAEKIESGAVSVAEQLKSLNGKELHEFFLANKNEIFKLVRGNK